MSIMHQRQASPAPRVAAMRRVRGNLYELAEPPSDPGLSNADLAPTSVGQRTWSTHHIVPPWAGPPRRLLSAAAPPPPARTTAPPAPPAAGQRTSRTYPIASLWVGLAVCVPTYMLAAGLVQ